MLTILSVAYPLAPVAPEVSGGAEQILLTLDRAICTLGVQAVFDDGSRGRYYVAEDDGQVAASLLVTSEWSDWRAGVVWWIQSVYVAPAARRRGTPAGPCTSGTRRGRAGPRPSPGCSK